MSLVKGKKGLIMGVANERSIAWGISQKLAEAGAELAFTYLGDALKKRVVPLAKSLNSDFTLSCNVENKEEIVKLFEDIKAKWGQIDFVVHAIAFSDKSEYESGLLQLPQLPESILHSNVESSSLLLNWNVADWLLVGLSGPEVILVIGEVMSIVQLW